MRRSSRAWLLVGAAAAVFGPLACTSILSVGDVVLRNKSTSDGGRGPSDPDEPGDIPPTPGPGPTPVPPPGDGGTGGGVCNGAPACIRIVFATSQTFNGNLGGIAGANQKCTQAGQKIPGHQTSAFRAWLSDTNTDARDSMPKGTMPYRRVDTTTVATSWDDLVDGNLGIPIAIDETGTAVSGTVWTGTSADGVKLNGDYCLDWTDDGSGLVHNAAFGDPLFSDPSWSGTIDDLQSCNALNHLYCIEF